MKILFAGTPAIAVPALRALAEKGYAAGVLTNPDRPSGRKRIPEPSPVKQCALEYGIKVFQPEKPDEEFISLLKEENFDVLITFAYGKIFKENFLALFRDGAYNIHPSLLPRFRGASPINAAILAGESETGISIQKMSLKMDAGDIVMQFRFPLNGTENSETLSEFVAAKSGEMISEFADRLAGGNITGTPQDDSKATYCRIIGKEEGRIDWNEDARTIERKIRGYFPWPGSYTIMGDKTLTITRGAVYTGEEFADAEEIPGRVLGSDRQQGIIIAAGAGKLAVTRLKPQAKNEMDWKSFLNGNRNFIGTQLGENK